MNIGIFELYTYREKRQIFFKWQNTPKNTTKRDNWLKLRIKLTILKLKILPCRQSEAKHGETRTFHVFIKSFGNGKTLAQCRSLTCSKIYAIYGGLKLDVSISVLSKCFYRVSKYVFNIHVFEIPILTYAIISDCMPDLALLQIWSQFRF